jgi:hypothetical protein
MGNGVSFKFQPSMRSDMPEPEDHVSVGKVMIARGIGMVNHAVILRIEDLLHDS